MRKFDDVTRSHARGGAARPPLRLPLVVWLCAAALAVAGLLSGGQPVPAGQPAPQTYVVEMKDFFFDPIGLVLDPGDTVVWLEAGEQAATHHTATAYHPDFDKVLRIPEDAPAWNSGFLTAPGQTYARTFTEAGTHDYFCIPHEDTGMVGRIVVGAPGGPGSAPLSAGVSAAGRSVMPTEAELLGPVGEVFNVQGRLNAVMLPWRQGDRGDALARWAVLRDERAALLPQFAAALAAAGEVASEEAAAAEAEWAELDAALARTHALADALDAVDAFKLWLEQAAYRVAGSPG